MYSWFRSLWSYGCLKGFLRFLGAMHQSSHFNGRLDTRSGMWERCNWFRAWIFSKCVASTLIVHKFVVHISDHTFRLQKTSGIHSRASSDFRYFKQVKGCSWGSRSQVQVAFFFTFHSQFLSYFTSNPSWSEQVGLSYWKTFHCKKC